MTYASDLVVIADLTVFNTDFVKVGNTATVIDILPNGNLWLNCSSWEYKQLCSPHRVKPNGVAQSEVKETPLVSIVKDVTYPVSIKGTLFTFTQDEINELTEELLGFSDDF